MPVLYTWENDSDTVMRVTFAGRWNWTEAAYARGKIYEILDTLDHKVDFVICYDNENWLPANYYDNMYRFSVFDIHPNAGTVVFVLKNELFAQFLRLFITFNGSLKIRFAHAKSIEEARLQLLESVTV